MTCKGGTSKHASTSTPSSPIAPYRVSTRTPTSFVFTSSKYCAPDGSLIVPHNRPALPPSLLRRHSAYARNSADFGKVLPGFIPLPLPAPPRTPSPPEEKSVQAFAFLPPRMKPAPTPRPHQHSSSEGTRSASPTLVSASSSEIDVPHPQPKQSMSELLARGEDKEKDTHHGRDANRKHIPKAKYNHDGTRRDLLVVAAHHVSSTSRPLPIVFLPWEP